MSKYAQYAQKLDTAFKAAREKYMEVYDAVKAAEKRVEDAKNEKDEYFRGDADIHRAECATALRKAEIVFERTAEEIWPAFDEVRDELTKKLRAEIQADTIAAPEDIDPNGMTLLQSGILRVDELESLAERYAENYTMLRILGQHAKAAADKAEDTDARWRLVNISRAADRDPGVVLQTWDGLLEACRVCSGRRLGEKHGDPSFVASISKTWERLTEAAIESF